MVPVPYPISCFMTLESVHHHNDLEQRLRRLLRREVVYNIGDLLRECDYIQGNGMYMIAFRPDALVLA